MQHPLDGAAAAWQTLDMTTAFLAIPMTLNFDERGIMKPSRQRFYREVIDALRRRDLSVLCGAELEDWGRIRRTPAEFCRWDVDSLRRSDLLVVVASESLSRGIHIEVGLAVGMDLPVIAFVREGEPVSSMLTGLSELGRVDLSHYADEADALRLLSEYPFQRRVDAFRHSSSVAPRRSPGH